MKNVMDTPIQNRFIVTEMTVQQFWMWLCDSAVNLNPIGQRNPVEANSSKEKLTKAQGIIASMLDGLDIGEVSFVHSDESLDGGHRSRCILDFLTGLFPLHKSSKYGEVYFAQLPKNIRDYFYSYKLRITDFPDLTGISVGKQFQQTNTTTPPIFPEIINAYGYSHTVVNLREYTQKVDYGLEPKVEGYKGVVDNQLEYFSKDVGYKNHRHIYFQQVLESAVQQAHGSFTSVTDNDIYNYVNKTTKSKVKSVEKDLESEYEFYSTLSKYWKDYARKAPKILDFHLFRVVYWVLREKSKNFKISDWDAFTNSLVMNTNDFLKSNERVLYTDDEDEQIDSRYATITGAFKSYVKKVNEPRKYTQAKIWVEELLDTNTVVFKDSARGFTKEDLLKRWNEVGKVNEITGEPIPFQAAVGCHIVPHSDGGKTTYDNLLISDKYHNTKMGTMNALKYKKMYEDGLVE